MVENGQYIRNNSTSRKALARACLDYYGLNEGQFSCYIFPSGMSAISSLFMIFGGHDKRYLVGDELFAGTYKVLRLLSGTQIQGYDTVYQENVPYELAFFESCSNPHGKFFDYDLLNHLNEKYQTIRIIDNTWLSGCSFNPFKVGADIVVESMSKYLSNSKCIAGMVIARRKYGDLIYNFASTYGLHVSPDTSDKILSTIGQTEDRIRASSHQTSQVIDQLRDRDVVYPELNRSVKYVPSLFVLYIPLERFSPHVPKLSFYAIKNYLSDIVPRSGLHYETSFGSAYHRIDIYPKIVDRQGQKQLLLRVYVGYEQPIEDLVTFLRSL